MSPQTLRDEVQAILGEEHPYEGISGGAEYLHTIGYGYLDEEDRDATAAQQASETTGAGASSRCEKCGQYSLLGVGRCACEQVEEASNE